MAHSRPIFRTSTMSLTGKKSVKGVKIQSDLHHHRGLANGGRRHTMLSHQQPRDSVLSNGSSDRSSSVSDETVLSAPTPPDMAGGVYNNDIFGFDVDEQIREAWPLKCCFVVKEIMQTEIAYVQSLADIIKGYLTPLYSHLLNSGESPNFIKTVFSNIVKIHQTHQELMEGFQDTFSSPHDFASNFLHADFLGLYSVYCTSFAQGNECLERALNENGDLREFIERCQHVLGHSLPLSSQLIKPVQRILKYRLLLEELNKHFDHSHPAHETVQEALEKMSKVAEQINTSFSSQKRPPKDGASAVAKRRINQLRELQKSRLSRGRHNPTNFPKLSQRSASETHLNFPSTTSRPHPDPPSHSHTLPNGNWASTPPPPSTARETRVLGGFSTSPPRRTSGEDGKGFVDSLPKVKQLKSYFEKLNKDGEEEVRRKSVSQKTLPEGMRKSRSMAGTKRDSISTVGLSPSPPWSPPWSPTKSPIKVPVLPSPPQPKTSPSKSPLRTLLKSPKKSPAHPKSPTKTVSILAPQDHTAGSPTESRMKVWRKSSFGSQSDLRVNNVAGEGKVGGGENFRKPPHPPDAQSPTTPHTSHAYGGQHKSAKALAANMISGEIKKHIAAATRVKVSARAQPAAPRTMV